MRENGVGPNGNRISQMVKADPRSSISTALQETTRKSRRPED